MRRGAAEERERERDHRTVRDEVLVEKTSPLDCSGDGEEKVDTIALQESEGSMGRSDPPAFMSGVSRDHRQKTPEGIVRPDAMRRVR
jgi:hypothetical protein